MPGSGTIKKEIKQEIQHFGDDAEEDDNDAVSNAILFDFFKKKFNIVLINAN